MIRKKILIIYFYLRYSVKTQVIVMAAAIKTYRISSEIIRTIKIWYRCRSCQKLCCRLNLCNSCRSLSNSGHSRCSCGWSLCWFRGSIYYLIETVQNATGIHLLIVMFSRKILGSGSNQLDSIAGKPPCWCKRRFVHVAKEWDCPWSTKPYDKGPNRSQKDLELNQKWTKE